MTEKQCLILTTNDCPGMRVLRVIGPVYGTSVRTRSIGGNWVSCFRAVRGGKQPGYTKMISATRDDALQELAKHALSLGANAVFAMRFDSSEFGSGAGYLMNEVTAYGTAVVLEAV
ncbi:hypothetical protein, conserved [Cyanidioschyzon merolae strain 10D]|jgi:uncharacterized protein YbjQ (UPF0145 family)|uniref:Uncharacterized protein n=1 Tax=Cyanidioschyzon merolae (strain NIES-3377 / 10D) TaxID=280699 RepID=M1UQD5_CYAM1|nr:hypothetical protein, conserved [Cyanidioschyzon merolae strain 10D]BAM79726.1 hypothetical protein, conserved [Cyanidioschyzon merolae strain 10D]|eukprot:XP_005536012.1 hypothetical protein, conserved [Cyanidioschyzon merolae strain 10D]